jgi:hypothetical protein
MAHRQSTNVFSSVGQLYPQPSDHKSNARQTTTGSTCSSRSALAGHLGSKLQINQTDPRQPSRAAVDNSRVAGVPHPGHAATFCGARGAQSRAASSTYSTKPASTDNGKVLHSSFYAEGTIFSAVFHEQDFNQSGIIQNNFQTVTSLGTIYSKLRKYVVVAAFDDHCIAIPIGTSEGRGLQNKTLRGQYISIREYDYRASAAPAETGYGILWAEASQEMRRPGVGKWGRMTDQTHVNFTSPVSHFYNRRGTICGALKAESISQLRKLWLGAAAIHRDTEEDPETPKAHGHRTETHRGHASSIHSSTSSVQSSTVPRHSSRLSQVSRPGHQNDWGYQ